jgi:membrane associated rhomboid family serine protease
MSVVNKIFGNFKSSGILVKLIVVNVAVFLILNLSYHFGSLDLSKYTVMYSEPFAFLTHFWGLFTYMFTHMDLGHVFYNMLWLFFMGQAFISIIGANRVFFVYLFGGISGGLLYMLSALVFPQLDGALLGASAAVMAITVAIGFYAPNLPVNVFLIGEVKLKWVVLGSFVMFSLIDFSVNSGGKISHIGGAVFGMIYGIQLKNRRDIGTWFTNLFQPRSKLKLVHSTRLSDEEYNYNRNQKEKTLDELLEKIHKSGYDSLSKKDKETLHRLSKNQ